MPKYIVTLKFFCYLFPKKNYNKKTLVFLPRQRGHNAFMQKQEITMITSVQAVLSRSSVIFSKLAEVSKLGHHALP